jgi:hypothetical protein
VKDKAQNASLFTKNVCHGKPKVSPPDVANIITFLEKALIPPSIFK